MHLIFDCNVLISALLANTSIPGKALIKARLVEAVLLISTDTLAELIAVLMRPKFDKYASLDIRQAFLEEIRILSFKVEITERVRICSDPKDDMYLELALSGKADCIISGDKDLLTLNPYKNIPIITPKEFLVRF